MSAERLATGEFLAWQVATGAIDSRGPAPEPGVAQGFGDVAHQLEGTRFRVLGSLGQGGMGIVLDAWDEQLGRPVAIKVCTRVPTPERLARFTREGELAAALDHSGVVRVHGGGVTPVGYPFLVMERVEGARSLGEVLDEIDVQTGVALLEEVARTVGAAHHAGIVHRDLKFDNVIVDADGRTKVCDFGLAMREGQERLTQEGALIGTPHFMPPEQAGLLEDVPLGPTADVWALGVMLYHLVAGRFPFEGSTWRELSAKLAQGAPPLPADAPPGLDAVCRRALSQEPEGRYPDGEAFADALVAARNAPPVSRSRRGSIAGAVCLGLGAAVWLGVSRSGDDVDPTPTPTEPQTRSATDPRSQAAAQAERHGRDALRAADPGAALRYLKRAHDQDRAVARRWARKVAEQWIGASTDRTATLRRLESIVALLGVEGLPRSAGDMYYKAYSEGGFQTRSTTPASWVHLERMSLIAPRRLSEFQAVLVATSARESFLKGRFAVTADRLLVLTRCADPGLLRLSRLLSDRGLAHREGLYAALGKRIPADWAARFVRGVFVADHLHDEPRDLTQALAHQAREDLRATGTKPRSPIVDAQVRLWQPVADHLIDRNDERFMKRLRALLTTHPDEHLVRTMIVRLMRRMRRPTAVLKEVPPARAAVDERNRQVRLQAVPPGGSPSVAGWEVMLRNDARWARKRLRKKGAED